MKRDVFERLVKDVTEPIERNSLAQYMFYKEHTNARRYVKGKCIEVYSPYATANT